MRRPSDLGKCSSTLEGNALEIAPESGLLKLQFPEGSAVGSRAFSFQHHLPFPSWFCDRGDPTP